MGILLPGTSISIVSTLFTDLQQFPCLDRPRVYVTFGITQGMFSRYADYGDIGLNVYALAILRRIDV